MKVDVNQAISLLLRGDVVALPTETVYGLAASLKAPSAIQKIFDLKNRPANNPLIVHISSLQAITSYVDQTPPHFEELAQAFWPGPLTLILPTIPEKIPHQVSAGLPTTAFRFPSHPIAREVLENTGPLVIPSANLSGSPSSTYYSHVERDFGRDFPVLDGGACSKGLESTILIFHEERWVIARLGALAAEDFCSVLPYAPDYLKSRSTPLCPGQCYRHYSPKAKLILGGPFLEASLIIGFEGREYPTSAEVWRWGSLEKPQEVAKSLYHLLRQLDLQERKVAWIDNDFPQVGLWKTLHERLQKAASSTGSPFSILL
ncbi:Threonylcarbamoyl-AMP synthase [Chlamydiales bacterium STE3]|nr:Threonylcarbamoyl-AMP synthase [Chlamydiales bacterium STE3]